MNFFQRIQQISTLIGVHLYPVMNSSNVEAYGYKDTSLYILFKGNLLYTYPNINHKEFNSLSVASSKGIWVSNHLVKTHKPFTKAYIDI